jgi:hypothetical protein
MAQLIVEVNEQTAERLQTAATELMISTRVALNRIVSSWATNYDGDRLTQLRDLSIFDSLIRSEESAKLDDGRNS